jgi:two-component system, cell cycle response regulator DivK
MEKIILVADDEPMNLRLIKNVLHSAGYKTLEAADGRQAIDLAMAHRPDLILMDVSMPVMDGFEAAEALKTDPGTRDIPLIAVTAFAMKEDEERILAAGYDGYVTKPIEIRKFIKDVAGYLHDQDVHCLPSPGDNKDGRR